MYKEIPGVNAIGGRGCSKIINIGACLGSEGGRHL